MKINIICIGTIKEKYFTDAINEYRKRLTRFCTLNIIELPQCKIDEPVTTLKFEEEKILPHCTGYVILLDIQGKQFSSPDFAKNLKTLEVNGNSTITFIIGGSFGVSNRVREQASLRLSFSQFTFPHQLFRVMLLEQIYRALSINAHLPYHK